MEELVTTYFVHFDENFQLKQTETFQDSDQDSVTEENKLWDYEQRYTEDPPNNTKFKEGTLKFSSSISVIHTNFLCQLIMYILT